MKKNKSRRSFLKKAALGSAALGSAPYIIASPGSQELLLKREYPSQNYTANDAINLALIGSGIQGIYDTSTALQVPGVQLVAVCDLYTGRLARAKEFGEMNCLQPGTTGRSLPVMM